MGVRAAEDLGVEHSGELHVAGVDGLAGDLAHAFDARGRLADDAVLCGFRPFPDLRLLRH
jgi:hypothetical protein